MKRALIAISLLLLMAETNSIFWRRRRRRRRQCGLAVNCRVGSWTGWSSCSHQCGTSGTQTRTRQQTQAAYCGGSCLYNLSETRACNRGNCENGGTPYSSGCSCRSGYRGTCCEYGEFRLRSVCVTKLGQNQPVKIRAKLASNRKRKRYSFIYYIYCNLMTTYKNTIKKERKNAIRIVR